MTTWFTGRRQKFGNTKVIGVSGQRFDSKFEAARAMALVSMQRAGLVRNLLTQVPFEFVINGVLVCRYIADFTYDELVGTEWLRVVEDCKSPATRKEPAYRIKYKLMLAVHGITIRETLENTTWMRPSRSGLKTAKSRLTARRTPS